MPTNKGQTGNHKHIALEADIRSDSFSPVSIKSAVNSFPSHTTSRKLVCHQTKLVSKTPNSSMGFGACAAHAITSSHSWEQQLQTSVQFFNCVNRLYHGHCWHLFPDSHFFKQGCQDQHCPTILWLLTQSYAPHSLQIAPHKGLLLLG